MLGLLIPKHPKERRERSCHKIHVRFELGYHGEGKEIHFINNISAMWLVSLWNHQNSWISYTVSFQNTHLNPHPVNLLTLGLLYYYLKFYSIYLN